MVNANLTNSQTLSGSNTTNNATNIVFIDTAVENFSSLLAGLKPNTEAVILDPTINGVNQITNFLAQHSGTLDSVQILSHGGAGSLQLGSTRLSAENLEQYQSALSQWFSPATGKTPDLLIYGCDVASGVLGTQFINQLSTITGADVAASVDLTGSAAKGGNWILEKATGAIEAGQAFTQKVRDAYQDVLATFTVKNNNDSGVDSLRQAILDANNTAAPDDIVFDIGTGGTQTIKLLTPLPVITTRITLDGTTQPGAGGNPAIELRGDAIPEFTNPNLANTTNGLTFWNGSGGSIARGFIINRFQSNGIKVGAGNNYNDDSTKPWTNAVPGPSGVIIENNYIGTDISGTVGLGNSWWGDPEVSNGLYIHRSPNTIIRNNLISGNTTTALIVRESSTNVQIIDNKIGTDVTGNLPLGSQRWSVYINNGSNGLFQGNLVAASGYDYETHGMEMLETYGTNMTINNNSFGTDITGTKSFRNRGHYQLNANTIYPGEPYVVRLYSNDTVTNNRYLGAWFGSLGGGNTKRNLPDPPKPILTTIAPELGTISNDIIPSTNQGDLISNLISNSINNPDGSQDKGISITQVNNTGGTWEYSTDNGTNWSDLAGAITFKYNFTNNNPRTPAFLLAADNKNRIRFVPNAGFVGTVTNGVVYNGWNQRTAGNGLVINIATGGRLDLQPLFNSLSANTDSLSVKVTGVNNAPILNANLIAPLAALTKDPVTNPGTLVTGLIPGVAVTDPDVGSLKGIAVTGVDNSNGTWEYTTNGITWLTFGSPTPAAARLLAADAITKVRFVPNAGYEGAPEISFRAWDQTKGVAGGTDDVSINGGMAPYSSDLGKGAIAVGDVPLPAANPENPPSIPLEILLILKNPDAPLTPEPVVVGEPPKNDGEKTENDGVPPAGNNNLNGVGGIGNGAGGNGNLNGGNPPAGNENCSCETIIKQQKPNVTDINYFGTSGDDLLMGTGASETFYGNKSNDTLLGAGGNDNLYGEAGKDLIRGGRGRDFVRGGQGADTLYGGRGSDVILGLKGADIIYGGRGADMLSGGHGNDTIYGDRGNDFISGGKGSDRLFGGAGNDNLCGCEGDDFLRGGRGNDVLNGEKGNDILVGGFGDDTLTGGAGKDRFRFAPSTSTDTITDFTIGEDAIELVKGLKLSDLQITQGVGATVINFQPASLFASDKPLAVLTGVNAATLTPNSFLVV